MHLISIKDYYNKMGVLSIKCCKYSNEEYLGNDTENKLKNKINSIKLFKKGA